MFEQHAASKRNLGRYGAISIGVHGALVALFLVAATLRAREPAKKEVEVSFIGPGKGKGAPPPPPPPAAKKHTTPKRKLTLAKVEVPKTIILPPKVVEPPPKEEPPEDDSDDDGEEGGVEGGVAGGVKGGVVGGQIGGTGGGGTMVPARPPPKNVPAFKIQTDLISRVDPRMSEVFKNGHRGQSVNGMYKVCIDLDGHVYEVTPVKSIPGADEEIIEGVKNGYVYKPQQVPVCFLFNFVVTIPQ